MIEKKIPTGHLGRFARVAAAGARMGASKLFKAEADGSVEKAAELLGTLRGVAAKLGQMASYVDGIIPEDQRETYEKGMRTLLSAAPRSSTADIRKTVEMDFQAPIDRLFVEWHDEPIASASVGQVHRATLEDGRKVAVKVQHPGISHAMESDLENIGLLEGLAALGGSRKLDSKRLFSEAAERLREELDYQKEAENQARFAALHADDPTIRIPAVISERTSSRVLTTEFVEGRSFDQAIQGTEAERRAWAETLWRFVYKGNMMGGMFNADPHPGNYFFHDGGQVTFIDFGCVQPINEKKRVQGISVHRSAVERDEAAFAAAVRVLMDTRGGGHERRTIKQLRDIYHPLFASPFRVTRDYTMGLVKQMKAFGQEARVSKENDYVPLPEGFLFMNRLQFGFYSILARLDVEVDYATVERNFIHGH